MNIILKIKQSDIVFSKCRLIFYSLLSLLIFYSSCKVNYTLSGASIPPDAKTFSVKYFQVGAPLANPTYSQALTESLKNYCLSRSRLSLISMDGDLNFEGTITGYATSPIAIQSNDRAQMNRLTITLNVIFTNKKDEKKNFESSFSRFADFPSSSNLAAVENDLIKQINDQLVQDIFNKAFNNW